MDVKMADRLAEFRKKNNYSQEELADKLGISRQAVSKWERAESSPDTDNLIALAKLYGVTIDTMLNNGGTERVNETNTDYLNLKVNDSEADDYLRMYKRGGLILGLGIACVFLAVISLLAILEFTRIESLAFIVFFVILSAGVGIILAAVFPLRRFEYIERNKKPVELTQTKQSELTAKYKSFSPKFIALLVISICMILLSAILPVIFQNILSIIIMLAVIALSASIIVAICFEYSVYEKLLGIGKKQI